MRARIIAIAVLTLLIQGSFAVVGFLVGLACAGLYVGYWRAWELIVTLPTVVEVEDD